MIYLFVFILYQMEICIAPDLIEKLKISLHDCIPAADMNLIYNIIDPHHRDLAKK